MAKERRPDAVSGTRSTCSAGSSGAALRPINELLSFDAGAGGAEVRVRSKRTKSAGGPAGAVVPRQESTIPLRRGVAVRPVTGVGATPAAVQAGVDSAKDCAAWF